jgi:hypothetical protein
MLLGVWGLAPAAMFLGPAWVREKTNRALLSQDKAQDKDF